MTQHSEICRKYTEDKNGKENEDATFPAPMESSLLFCEERQALFAQNHLTDRNFYVYSMCMKVFEQIHAKWVS